MEVFRVSTSFLVQDRMFLIQLNLVQFTQFLLLK